MSHILSSNQPEAIKGHFEGRNFYPTRLYCLSALYPEIPALAKVSGMLSIFPPRKIKCILRELGESLQLPGRDDVTQASL